MSEENSASKPRGGNKGIRPEDGKKTQYSKDYQPPPENKSAGKRKRRMLRELLDIVTNKKFNDKQKSEWHKLAAAYFGVPENEVTVELMMDFRQLEKAINTGATDAYNAVKDRVYGKPKQSIDLDADVNFDTAVYIGKKQLRKD